MTIHNGIFKDIPFSPRRIFCLSSSKYETEYLMKAYLPIFFQFYSGKCNIYENYKIKYSDTKKHPAASQQLTLE